MHCSYWKEFGGGLHYPLSSYSFFKNIIDIINFEYWGLNEPISNLLNGFSVNYDLTFNEEDLFKVYSVEFLNSICLIKKTSEKKNKLGRRVVAGSANDVYQDILQLHDTLISYPLQQNNPQQEIDIIKSLLDKVIKEHNITKEILNETKEKLESIINSNSWKLTRMFGEFRRF